MMKIAFVANDTATISAHFGRATAVVVVTVEDGQEVARETREKEGHGANHVHMPGEHEAGHHKDHTSKFTAMADCQVLVVRGMGSPAVAHAREMGLEVYITQERSIDAALNAYLSGALDHDDRRIHHH